MYICREIGLENIIHLEILYNILWFKETSDKIQPETKKITTDTELQRKGTS